MRYIILPVRSGSTWGLSQLDSPDKVPKEGTQETSSSDAWTTCAGFFQLTGAPSVYLSSSLYSKAEPPPKKKLRRKYFDNLILIIQSSWPQVRVRTYINWKALPFCSTSSSPQCAHYCALWILQLLCLGQHIQYMSIYIIIKVHGRRRLGPESRYLDSRCL